MTELLTIDDLSKKLKIQKRSIYFFAQQGKIPGAFKFGKHWRFRQDMIDQWIDEQTKPKVKRKSSQEPSSKK